MKDWLMILIILTMLILIIGAIFVSDYIGSIDASIKKCRSAKTSFEKRVYAQKAITRISDFDSGLKAYEINKEINDSLGMKECLKKLTKFADKDYKAFYLQKAPMFQLIPK